MQVQKARISDVPQMQQLIQFYADRGEMLVRPLSELYENIRDFFVVHDEDGNVCGCVGLHLLWSDIAEVKAMAVREDMQGKGVGRLLCEACIAEANDFELAQIFAFTYKPGFFSKLGFYQVEPMTLPRKVWGECFRCPKFGQCDEIAMVLDLRPTHAGQRQPISIDRRLPLIPVSSLSNRRT